MTRKEAQTHQKRLTVLVDHLARTTGPLNADSLSRSFGLPLPDVQQILTKHGRL